MTNQKLQEVVDYLKKQTDDKLFVFRTVQNSNFDNTVKLVGGKDKVLEFANLVLNDETINHVFFAGVQKEDIFHNDKTEESQTFLTQFADFDKSMSKLDTQLIVENESAGYLDCVKTSDELLALTELSNRGFKTFNTLGNLQNGTLRFADNINIYSVTEVVCGDADVTF